MYHNDQSRSLIWKQNLCGIIFFYAALGFATLCGVHDRAHGTDISNPPIHVVRQGETLSEIALDYGVSVYALKSWNKLRGDTIFKGQKLQVGAHPLPAW